ncbi:hypothetical protein [Flavobacterium subsaxonicum]|uniref:Uncharacterized protein n=1 Tax=Flavobacterium subsaxonicum WB 4.1-42 = DSM 21790 TaxID=1121898 RepID=A0A0A2MVI4_9FLAO|nr:hypothetical protein [Flavobacterium subsaxonicum]KGO92215.1 hypothetical protein Q766_13720 [Flavobacterium subsaxonicum WB 4.1-42 = DSM 21790]
MEKLSNQKKEEELLFIKDWCLTIIDHLDTISVNNSMASFKNAIINGYTAKNLRGMRLALKDITKMAQYFDVENVSKINHLLKEKFGKDLNDDSGKTQKKINQIIKRGKIVNPDEFRILKEKAEEIYSDVEQRDIFEKISSLLLNFEQISSPEL